MNMQKSVRKKAASLLLAMIIMLCPALGLAADLNFNIAIARQDGVTCGELWVDNALVWRLALLSDGAKPVIRNINSANTMLVIPDIINGMFVIKVE
jgi:hypothetical protein